MLQYEAGHSERVEWIGRELPPGVFVVGQAYGGAGIPDCVRGAAEVAGRIRTYLVGNVEGERAP
jgi:protoporphyrinogen oxidase